MASQSSGGTARSESAEPWIGLGLCAAVLAAWAVEQLARTRPAFPGSFAPGWLPVVAAGLAAAALLPWNGRGAWARARRALLWSGLLLMVWAANGLPLDLLRLTPLIPLPVDWPGLARKLAALAGAGVLAHVALARPTAAGVTRVASWYGYAAFVLALPYPVLRTWWALGGTPGLAWPGAGGRGWLPWLACIPWLLAAVLSLLLVPTWHRLPRRLLLVAGWSATAIVAMIGPAACWAIISTLIEGKSLGGGSGIADWVFGLFYGSWLLWAIAAGAATRSYQRRSALPS